MSPADGLVVTKNDVTVLASDHILFAGKQIVGLTCGWQDQNYRLAGGIMKSITQMGSKTISS